MSSKPIVAAGHPIVAAAPGRCHGGLRAPGAGPAVFRAVSRGALAALLVVLAASVPATEPTSRYPRPAFDFALENVNPASPSHGDVVRLSRLYRDRGIVLNFIASWCGPCRDELPRLQAIHESGRAAVVCVAADEYGGPDALGPLMESAGLTMPVLYAPDAEAATIAEHYDYAFLPATYFIDAAGSVLAEHQGVVAEKTLLRDIRRHLRQPRTDRTAAGTSR